NHKVSSPRSNMPFVAIKMGRRQGARRAHPAPLSILLVLLVSPGQHKSGAGRNRRATQPPAHFHRNPLGRGRLAVFPRCSLLTSRTIFAPTGEIQILAVREWCGMLVARALKNSQLTC